MVNKKKKKENKETVQRTDTPETTHVKVFLPGGKRKFITKGEVRHG